ncbi:MAG: hypothetical protein KF721_11585 [Ignavibacteriaceae bacterium]|nr:hypothetical protein [Ignavibacteriaceae bacterium]HRI47521.1 hypothetical protein [Ignavibacteriaceae bacterium]
MQTDKFKFEEELKLLDAIYTDMLEAIEHKPSTHSLENLILYTDNVYVLLNRTALRVQEIKKAIEADKKFVIETYNSPA